MDLFEFNEKINLAFYLFTLKKNVLSKICLRKPKKFKAHLHPQTPHLSHFSPLFQ